MKIATISSKGQITLPRSLLRELDLKPKQKVFIERDQDYIQVKPIKKSIVDELAGSLYKYIPKEKRGVPWDVVMKETKRIVAEKIAKGE